MPLTQYEIQEIATLVSDAVQVNPSSVLARDRFLRNMRKANEQKVELQPTTFASHKFDLNFGMKELEEDLKASPPTVQQYILKQMAIKEEKLRDKLARFIATNLSDYTDLYDIHGNRYDVKELMEDLEHVLSELTVKDMQDGP